MISNIDDRKIEKLAGRLAKSFAVSEEEAMELIYEEWEYVQRLFSQYSKVKTVHRHLMDAINYIYRIA